MQVPAWAGNPAWDQLHNELAGFLPNAAGTASELLEVVKLIEYRAGVMAEALTQRTNPWAWFRGILMCNSKSAPATHQLVTIANVVGQFVVMHYKMDFKRARPSQYSPAILPPIEVPGHALFPSGHATEAYLIALILEAVMPAAAKEPGRSCAGQSPAT